MLPLSKWENQDKSHSRGRELLRWRGGLAVNPCRLGSGCNHEISAAAVASSGSVIAAGHDDSPFKRVPPRALGIIGSLCLA